MVKTRRESSSKDETPLHNRKFLQTQNLFVFPWLLAYYSHFQRGPATKANTASHAGWWKQLDTLTRRSFVNMSRDMGYYWLRIIIYLVVSICVGTIFFDVGTSYTAILARGACGGFITGFMTFMSIGSFPSFIEDMKVRTQS